MARKHISWKTRCAAFALALGDIPYEDAKQMTEDQILSLYNLDHNILHSSEHEDRDKFWNLTPMLTLSHRRKTKQDAAIIAKSRRIRGQLARSSNEIHEALGPEAAYRSIFGQTVIEREIAKSRLRSRGFDKTKTKGFDGKVRERKEKR